MNTLRNKVSLIGRLGAQPEVVKFDSGRTLARFSLATNESYKNKEGEWQDVTQWHIMYRVNLLSVVFYSSEKQVVN